jgi:hypothetical protein
MYVTLFKLAGLAAPAWLLLIFLPKWKFTRWLARTAIVPALIALIYLAGVGLLVTAEGFGFMRDFGSAEGVTRLLARQDVAMVAWIHILAFDQLVGLTIYRDNMEHRYVSIPIQSVILFLTFMLGPIGFLTYYLLRQFRGNRNAVDETTTSQSPSFRGGKGITGILRLGRDRLMEVRPLTVVGVVGITVGVFCLGVINQRRSAFVPPEGHLDKAAAFDIALGLYTLTLAFFVPGARFSPLGRKIWVNTSVVLMLWSYSVETLQILRGLDPRFSRAGSPTVQMLGGVFFLTANTLIVLFAILTWKYFRKRDNARDPLVLATRYGFAAVYAGFAAGLWLSFNNSSKVGEAGNILPLHALGFHGLQAIPAIALLLVWSNTPSDEARRWIHIAGIAWLLACAAVAIQTAAGHAIVSVSAASIAAAMVLLVWVSVGSFALIKWSRPAVVPTSG